MQSPPPDAPMDGQPKQRREVEDVEMTAILAQLASESTYLICTLLVYADLADNSYVEEGLRDGNMKEKIENENAVGLATISVHNAANPEG